MPTSLALAPRPLSPVQIVVVLVYVESNPNLACRLMRTELFTCLDGSNVITSSADLGPRTLMIEVARKGEAQTLNEAILQNYMSYLTPANTDIVPYVTCPAGSREGGVLFTSVLGLCMDERYGQITSLVHGNPQTGEGVGDFA